MNQFHKEPIRPVVCLELLEVGTDDGEGPVHHTISHRRLEISVLSNDDMGGLKD